MTRGVHSPINGPNMDAREFLETVALGHIRIDQWVKGVEGDGKAIVERPWLTLASDIHTRSIVAVVISFEPPSILTLLESLDQIVRPKEWLKAEFGDAMAASARGMPRKLVVGNEWDHVGASFSTPCQSAGVDLVFAPLKTLEFKGPVESLLRTVTEELFHRLPGATRHKPLEMPGRELDPRSEDLLTLEELRDRLWRWACTDYSMHMHRGIGMAPSRALKLSLEQNDRPIIDDIHSLDDLMGQIERMRRSVVHVTMSAKATPKTLANGHPQRVRRRSLSPRFG
jgi:putative transposase